MRAVIIIIIYLIGLSCFAQINKVSFSTNLDISNNTKFFINNYLERFLGFSANSKYLEEAQIFLQSNYFVNTVICNYHNENKDTVLNCDINIKSKIKNIYTKGLPAFLLESELLKKISLQVGQDIVIDESSKKNIFLQTKSRVENFLQQEGFYGSEITISYTSYPQNRNIDILIDIKKGNFVRINNVVIMGDDLPNVSKFEKSYKRMCFSFSTILESFSKGFNCYSPELESNTTKSLVQELVNEGYIQANIRVSKYWLNNDEKKAVNLRVDIDKGPKFFWKINIENTSDIIQSKFNKIFSSFFLSESLSRISISDSEVASSLDRLVSHSDIENEISFIASRNIDEQEISLSIEKIKAKLAARGYPNAEVSSSYTQQDEKNIDLIFNVDPKTSFFIGEINISPSYYNDFIDTKLLEKFISTRSLLSSGNISYAAMDDAIFEIKKQLIAKGFINVDVKTDLNANFDSSTTVNFYISSEKREVVEKINIINGNDKINNQLMPFLLNCDSYDEKLNNNCYLSSFIESQVEYDKEKIIDFYRLNGYFYVDIDVKNYKNNDKHIVEYYLFDNRYPADKKNSLKPQVIKEMLILGNSTVSENVLKRLFSLDSNIKVKALTQGIANIKSSGLFSRVEHKFVAGSNNSDDIYFLLNLTPKPSLTLDTGIAFSTDKFFSFQSEINEYNLFGSMLRLNTGLDLGLFVGRQTSFNNKIIWPNIWGKPVSLTINAPVFVYQDFLHRPIPSTRLQSKFSANLDFGLNKLTNIFLKYTLYHNQERILTDNTPLSFKENLSSIDGLLPTMKSGGKIRGVLKPGFLISNIDNIFLPHSGFELENWMELSGGFLFGNPPFLVVGTRNSFYVPISFLTIAMQVSLSRSFIKPNKDNWNDLKNASSMDRLGGDKSIRGYKEGNIGIEDTSDITSKYAGYFLNNLNMELRFPLPIFEESNNLFGAFFTDLGLLLPVTSMFSLFKDIKDTQLIAKRGLGLSFGASLRYLLPIGPISIDYGFSPIHKQSDYHLMLGYLF